MAIMTVDDMTGFLGAELLKDRLSEFWLFGAFMMGMPSELVQ